jgi:hypothetical protein
MNAATGRAPAALLVPLALLAVACADDDDGGRSAAVDDIGVTTPDRDGVPPGTDPAAVAPYLEDLLVDYDAAVNQITASPARAAAADDPVVRGYLDVFEPDSEIAAGAVAFWRDQGAVGLSTRPYAPDAPAFTTRVDGEVQTVSGGEVRFPTCGKAQYETVDAAGRRVDVEPGASVPGEGTAVLVGDEWKLRRIDQFTGTDGCSGEA